MIDFFIGWNTHCSLIWLLECCKGLFVILLLDRVWFIRPWHQDFCIFCFCKFSSKMCISKTRLWWDKKKTQTNTLLFFSNKWSQPNFYVQIGWWIHASVGTISSLKGPNMARGEWIAYLKIYKSTRAIWLVWQIA